MRNSWRPSLDITIQDGRKHSLFHPGIIPV